MKFHSITPPLLAVLLVLEPWHLALASPIAAAEEGPPPGPSPPLDSAVAVSDLKPTIISSGKPNSPETIIINGPPIVDVEGATDTSREEVETTQKRAKKMLGLDGTERNEVPVRQSSLEIAVAAKLRSECARREASACLKLKLLAYMNKLLKKASIPLTDAVEISQTSDLEEEDEDSVEEGDVEEEEALGEVVAEKVAAFVKTRSLRWKLLPEADILLTPNGDEEGTVEVGVSVRGGRSAADKGRGKLKQLLPILGAVKIKIGILVALAIAALALLVGKAVLISKIALLLAGILGLIKLLSRPQKAVTYEVVSHPHYTHHHGSSSTTVVDGGHHHEGYPGSSYGRSFDGADLAYRAWADGSATLRDGGVSNYR